MIRSLDQMVDLVISLDRKFRIAVAWAHDSNTLAAIHESVMKGFAEAILLGVKQDIQRICRLKSIDPGLFNIIECKDEVSASLEAVRVVRSGSADIVMKGLVGTDKFLKAVMDKENGLLLPGAVLSYVCALELPAYHKLLFITDTAVIPSPTLPQKIAMAEYALKMTKRFGIEKPKIALVSASEKKSRHFESSEHYEVMCRMADEGKFGNCIMDGPLDIFLACDSKSVEIKGINTPVNGDSDVLLFPSLESSNPFYKGLMLFAGGELAGLLMGTEKPVIVMSRSESEKSKFYCIALACLMA
jgi:phosphate butyryltransferase